MKSDFVGRRYVNGRYEGGGRALFIFAHGYASLYANNTMVYDERNVMKALENIFFGAICAVKGEQNEKYN